MREDLYQELYDLERDYWWHIGKRKIVFDLIRKYAEYKNDALDIGCGAGLVVEELGRYFKNAWGLDNSPEALKFCQERGLKYLVLSSAERINQTSGMYDTITALDVLEHLDDGMCLAECHRLLRPNGTIFVSVPSYPALWSYWDEMLGHKRRYTKTTLQNVLQDSGFRLLKISYSNFFILPLVTIARKLKSKSTKSCQQSDFIPTPALLNGTLKKLYAMESFIINSANGFPAGVSLVAAAQKL